MKGCGAEPTDVQCGTSRNTHGLANAFFRSHSQAQKALAMDKADMEGRYIELSMDQVHLAPSSFYPLSIRRKRRNKTYFHMFLYLPAFT